MTTAELRQLELDIREEKKRKYPGYDEDELINFVYSEIAWRLSSSNAQQSLDYIKKVENRFDIYSGYDVSSLIDALNTKSIIRFSNGEIEGCIEICIKLLELNKTTKNKKREASLYNNLGVYYRQSRNYQEALDCLVKSLELSQQLRDKRGLCNAYTNLGVAYLSVNDNEKALEYFTKAKKLGEETNNLDFIPTILKGFGTAYLEQGDYEKAMGYLNQALEHGEEFNFWDYPETLVTIAKCNRMMGNLKECKDLLDKALKYSNENKFRIDQVAIYREYAGYYEAVGQWDEAYACLKKSNDIETKVLARGRIRNLKQRLLEFELEEKNSIIERLSEERMELISRNNALNQFAQEASHDMREPIRMISSYIKLAIKKYNNKVLDNKGVNYLKYALNSSEFVHKLLANLMNYILVGQGLQEDEIIDLNKIIEEVENNLRLKIDNTNTILEVGKLPKIYGNTIEIVQLFQNLVGNGIKYCDKEYPYIKIYATKLHDSYVIAVQDNGIGISEKDKNKVFEIFSRVHDGNRYDGTGLGLAICKKIVDNLEGKIWLESTKNEGSVFFIQLPIERRVTRKAGKKMATIRK